MRALLPVLTLLWLVSVPVSAQPSPSSQPGSQCLNVQGRTVCGFKCHSNGTEARCAQTPYGVCQTVGGRVHCWDPPGIVVQYPPLGGGRAECTGNGGRVECGYNCRWFNGNVACARTPYGVCTTTSTRVFCWDPPDSVIQEFGSATPTPRCLTTSDAASCGYDCKSSGTQVRCASTPQGVCQVENGRIICHDSDA